MAKMTKSFVDKVAPPEQGYAIHWDDGIKGFGLRVTAAGRKSFVAQGRVQGKAVCVTIGPYGEWTEHQAREEARQILQTMRKGIDPRDAKKKDEAVKVTLQQVTDAYVSRPGKLKDSSKAEILRHVATTFEAWQHKPIISITEDACRKRYREMLTKGLRGDREGGSPGQSNQAFAVLRALINFAARQYKKADGTPLITYNPVSALKDDWVTLPERKTRIPESKIGAVWNALQQWRESAYNRDTLASIDLIMFLLLTGARISEAAELTWDRVNLDEGWWHLPDPKNRNPVWLPLSMPAIELLTTRERVKGSPFVFTTWSKAGHIRDPRDMMKKVSEVAGTKITPHDLRRSVITFGVANCGIDLHKIELLTNHVPKGVTARHYLETSHLQYLRPEVQRLADWIEEKARIAQAVAANENVISIRA